MFESISAIVIAKNTSGRIASPTELDRVDIYHPRRDHWLLSMSWTANRGSPSQTLSDKLRLLGLQANYVTLPHKKEAQYAGGKFQRNARAVRCRALRFNFTQSNSFHENQAPRAPPLEIPPLCAHTSIPQEKRAFSCRLAVVLR